MMTFKLFGITDVGQVRDHNEDDFAVCRDLSSNEWKFDHDEVALGERGAVMVVADGMGGTNAGEIASDIAQKSVRRSFESLETIPADDGEKISLLKAFILKAHDEIVAHQEQNLDTAGMGTTLVIAWVLEGKLYVAWSGDSRCYIFNPRQPLVPFTDDHSHVWEMVKQGHLSAEQARVHPESNLILQNLGDAANRPDPEGKTAELAAGDRVLVCSDGLNGMLSDERIHYLLLEKEDTQEACKRLVEEANRAGGQDNITLLLLDVVGNGEGKTDSRLVTEYRSESAPALKRRGLLFSSLFLVAFVALYHFALAPWLFTDSGAIHLGTHRATVNEAKAMILDPAAEFLPSGPEITRVEADKNQKHGTILVSGNKLVYTPRDSSGAFTDNVRVTFYTGDNVVFSSLYELTRTAAGTSPEVSDMTDMGQDASDQAGREEAQQSDVPGGGGDEVQQGGGESGSADVRDSRTNSSVQDTVGTPRDSTLSPDRQMPDSLRSDSAATADTSGTGSRM